MKKEREINGLDKKIPGYILLAIGILFLLFLLLSYFINIEIDKGVNFVTITPLLGILIFYNVYLLIFYIIIGVVLILAGIKIISGIKFRFK